MVFNNKKFLECIHQESLESCEQHSVVGPSPAAPVYSRSFLLGNIDNITTELLPGQILNILFSVGLNFIETSLQ